MRRKLKMCRLRSDILQRLDNDGWVLKSQRGSHRQFVHPLKPGKVTVAGHPSDDPDDATYLSILRQGRAKAMREYAVVYGRTRTGWSAHVPDLPGLAATGASFAEVEQLMREGLEFHLESMLEDGDPIPDAETRVSFLQTDIVENFRAKFAKSA